MTRTGAESTTPPTTMRAVGYDRVGGPEVLREVQVPTPPPGPGEVLIEVAYAGVNFAEVVGRRGGAGEVSSVRVPGHEAAGRVAALGPGVEGVEGLALGDPVAALTHPRTSPNGGYAEYVVAPASLVVPLRGPSGEVELVQGAALPCAATTAYGLLDVTALAPGETVLIQGAAGGVGSIAGQVARELGAGSVIGVVGSPAKVEAAERAGCDRVYLREEFAEQIVSDLGERPIDIVLDSVAGVGSERTLALLAPLGRLIAFGNPGVDEDLSVSLHRLWIEARGVMGYNIGELAVSAPHAVHRHALGARDLLAEGRVTVDVSGVLPLAEAAEAHRRLESGATHGKLVLDVRG